MADGEGHERPEFASPSGTRKRPRDERKWKKTVAKEKRNSEAVDDPDPNPCDMVEEEEDLGERGFFDYQ
ncbi:hypothetical protein Pcinc_004029 [Petrolisthes cinctipes]|uniref:Uncharacterized protein n=1 Tax=Petrolisthes cinctipes TaxID=88211 RepID=A0AAE1L422_PETCI|nr:hypothetical protein Pcinc_004029 [Petrolisthes cinctipes]